MERLLVISVGAIIGTAFYIWCAKMLQSEENKSYIINNSWLRPNSICYERTVLAFIGYYLYFYLDYQSLAIIIFTFAAILDGVDGLVARECGLVSEWGKSLDPLCDKLTYLPPLLSFAGKGILSKELVVAFIAVEFFGQLFARFILARLRLSVAANNFGKIKAIVSFALVIYCALLDDGAVIINIGDNVLIVCIILAMASVVFKFVPNRLYADILSTLNLCCGISGLLLIYQHHYVWAIIVILMGQLFDLFDGRMADKHGGTKFGPWLDDTADFISFGLCPGYLIVAKGDLSSWLIGALFIVAVAYRLIRFMTTDKKRTDLPEGIFNGLPSPAGALIALGGCLAYNDPIIVLGIGLISIFLMTSRLHFAHFGRVILKQVPKPIFILTSALISIMLAYLVRAKNAEMFGILLMTCAIAYIIVGMRMANKTTSL